MMKFYLKKENSLKGYTLYQILQFVLQGRISIHQEGQVYSENSVSKGEPLYQIKEFRHFFPCQKDRTSWILLKKYKKKFVQSGPYFKKGLQIMLKRGLISDQDFVWREGFPSWERLSLCSEFHTRLDASLEDLMDQLAERYIPPAQSQITYYKRPVYPDWSKWRR